MNESSIWWGTIYAERNLTAMERESENQYKPGKLPDIPAVAWWQIGNDVKFDSMHYMTQQNIAKWKFGGTQF